MKIAAIYAIIAVEIFVAIFDLAIFDQGKTMSSRRMLLIATLPLLGLGCGESAKSVFGSGKFQTLTFTRAEGPTEFCPSIDEILSLTVSKTASGDFKAKGKKAAEGDPKTDTCDSRKITSMSCLVQKDTAEVTLTGSQVADLQVAIGNVPAKRCSAESGKRCAPCTILTIDVDGARETDQCCGKVNSTYTTTFRLLVGTIERLAP